MMDAGSTRSLCFFLLFCVFRILNVFLIQSQFDPDEYWQQLEPAYCYVFVGAGKECLGLTWEWKRRPSSFDIDSLEQLVQNGFEGPVRSYVSIIPTLLFYYVLKTTGFDTPWLVSRGPVFLNSVMVAAPTDWAVWYMSQWLVVGEKPDSVKQHIANIGFFSVFCSLSSWFNAYALVRTYSNSLETVLLAMSMCLVSPELLGPKNSDRKLSSKFRSCLCFFIGGVSCSIRFTCLTAYIPMGIILAFSECPGSLASMCQYLVSICATFGLLGISATILFDRFMFGFLAIPMLGNLHFNVLEGNGSLYGTHPVHWYFSAGIPAITGLILPILLYDLSHSAQWSTGRTRLWLICGVYSVAHSFSSHKEFRFLLPILPLFCILSGERLGSLTKSISHGRVLLVGWLLANLVAVCYLGLIHQRAPIEVNRSILQLTSQEPRTYTIHYLMGCHSTPVLSHLHQPPARYLPWTLDCSPKCRADPEVTCESELFARDPLRFLDETYFGCDDDDEEEETCSNKSKINPDFLVIEADKLDKTRERLTTMGMNEVGRYTHGLSGVSFDSEFVQNDPTKLHIIGPVHLSVDQFVLFRNERIGYDS